MIEWCLMFDDKEEPTASSPNASTIWVETEIRRLYVEREEWRSRWQDLKNWLSTHRSSLEWDTLTAIKRHMAELEKNAPAEYTILAENAAEQLADQ